MLQQIKDQVGERSAADNAHDRADYIGDALAVAINIDDQCRRAGGIQTHGGAEDLGFPHPFSGHLALRSHDGDDRRMFVIEQPGRRCGGQMG